MKRKVFFVSIILFMIGVSIFLLVPVKKRINIIFEKNLDGINYKLYLRSIKGNYIKKSLIGELEVSNCSGFDRIVNLQIFLKIRGCRYPVKDGFKAFEVDSLWRDNENHRFEIYIECPLNINQEDLQNAEIGFFHGVKRDQSEITLSEKDGDFSLETLRFEEFGIIMVKLPGGIFNMGSVSGDCDERPVHTVKIDSFYISAFEITQAQWKTVMKIKPNCFREGEDLPVDSVSWDDAQEFIRRLNNLSKKRYRLPTEAEWEYASLKGNSCPKGGDCSEYAWGVENSGLISHPVGTRKRNRFGLYDILGNLREWCIDTYNSNYYLISEYLNPMANYYGDCKVVRGGSFMTPVGKGTIHYRGCEKRWMKLIDVGFRIVCSAH